jgi:hypothetical protein
LLGITVSLFVGVSHYKHCKSREVDQPFSEFSPGQFFRIRVEPAKT